MQNAVAQDLSNPARISNPDSVRACDCLPGESRPMCETDNSFTSGHDIRNKWRHDSTALYVFVTSTLTSF